MSPRLADPDLNAIASSKLAELSEIAFADLLVLPDNSSETLTVAGRKIFVSVWHDVLPTGEHRIVVQVDRPRLGGIYSLTCADGFARNDKGDRRPLTVEELSAFT